MADMNNLKIRNRNYSGYGSGEYSGEVAKGTIGFVPQGLGRAVFVGTGSAPSIIQDGYFKKGEFIEGKLNFGDIVFQGAFDDGNWVKGRIDKANGDYYVGSFSGNSLNLEKFKSSLCNEGKAVFEGEVVANNISEIMLIKGVLHSTDGSEMSTGYFICPSYTSGRDITKISKHLINRDALPILVLGQIRKVLENGEVFVGARNFALTVPLLKKAIEKNENVFEYQAGEIFAFPKNEEIGESLQVTVPQIRDVPIDFLSTTVDAVFAPYFGKLSKNFDLPYTITGEFIWYAGLFSFICQKGDFDITLPCGTFKGTNNGILAPTTDKDDSNPVLDPLCFVKGVLTDKKHNTIYDGVFDLQQRNKKFDELFENGLVFRYGLVKVTKPACVENFKILPNSVSFNDCGSFAEIEGNVKFTNGDFYDGTFNLEVAPNEAISRKFVAGSLRKTLNTRDVNGAVTVYSLSNADTMRNGKPKEIIDGKNITYKGTIETNIEKNGCIEKIVEKGKFTGDFVRNNFELVDGQIFSERRDSTGEYLSTLNKSFKFGSTVIEGERISRNVACENGGSVGILHEKGRFDSETKTLVCGDFSLATNGERDYDLSTKDGVHFVGRVCDKLENNTFEKSGEFTRTGAFDFAMSEGEICLKTPEFSYKAIFDCHGIDAFDGAKFGGIITRQDGKKSALATSSIEQLYERFAEKTR